MLQVEFRGGPLDGQVYDFHSPPLPASVYRHQELPPEPLVRALVEELPPGKTFTVETWRVHLYHLTHNVRRVVEPSAAGFSGMFGENAYWTYEYKGVE